MTLRITTYGSTVLRKKCVEIDEDYEGLKELIDNMFETMEKAEGVGLAAPQIDRAIRLFVIDGRPMAEDDPTLTDFVKVFINPEITWRSEEAIVINEGCLSVPTLREDVKRPVEIEIEYQDENFEFHKEKYEGMPARIIQHEYDHLEGVLFTDKISPIKKRLIKNKLSALAKGKFNTSYLVKKPVHA